MVLPARILATVIIVVSAFVRPSKVFAHAGPCAAPEPFNGFWGVGQFQVRQRVAGIPLLAMTRFSYRQIRYSPCAGGMPVLPLGIGEAALAWGSLSSTTGAAGGFCK
ncbi:hypothetical protein NQZ70_07346 [Sorangium sp. Soce836]|nr:hypothetical protein NQZ70_07346 [Sorangium sp. Soce836]